MYMYKIFPYLGRVVYQTSYELLEQEWRSCESVLLPPMCPGLYLNPGPGVICGLSLLLVRYAAPRGFSLGTPVFPSPQKSTFQNSRSILECTDISEGVLVISLALRG